MNLQVTFFCFKSC